MNNPQKQTVYLPVKVQGVDGNYIPDESVLLVKEQGEMDKYWDALVKPQEGYFFTPEQLNEYTQSVIKQALETAAEKMYETFHTICEDGSTKGVFKTQKEALDFANILNNKTNLYHDWVKVTRLNGGMDKKSITNTFENTFEKFKV